jgi:hypothetical protein
MSNRSWVIFPSIVAGFLGGLCASFLLAPRAAEADKSYLTGSRMYVMGPDGKQRVQLAVYDAPGEAGLPLIGLSDNNQNLRLLLRLAGMNSSPVLVMKDKEHRDRLVIGLGLNDAAEEPFIASFDKNGQKKMVLGSY